MQGRERKLDECVVPVSEEAERASFISHPLIRAYARLDVNRTDRRVYKNIALRVLYETVSQEERAVLAVYRMRSLLCRIKLMEERWHKRRSRSLSM